MKELLFQSFTCSILLTDNCIPLLFYNSTGEAAQASSIFPSLLYLPPPPPLSLISTRFTHTHSFQWKHLTAQLQRKDMFGFTSVKLNTFDFPFQEDHQSPFTQMNEQGQGQGQKIN